jgi:hypothetical protein
LDPEGTTRLIPEDQRDFCADVYDTERDFLTDALAESLMSHPATAQKLLAAFRTGDFLQTGAVVDEILRNYLIGSQWIVAELREIQEQESFYDGDQ